MLTSLKQYPKNLPRPFEGESFDSLFDLDGEMVSQGPLNELIKVTRNNQYYYIKRYFKGGKNLRRYLGRNRLRGEWENLQYFKSLGINITPITYFAEEKIFSHLKRGVLITKGIDKAFDLKTLKTNHPQMFNNKKLRRNVIQQIAKYTALLHLNNFTHNDLKWRNIMIANFETSNPKIDGFAPKIIFFDCPLGSKKFGLWKRKGIEKDLSCLDKEAKNFLSRTDRLYFRKEYNHHITRQFL